jgi:hypothetical protein
MVCLIATDDVRIHHQCQQSIFPLRNRIYASCIIINNIETPKGLAMINGAAMPQQFTVKPSSHLSFYQGFDGPAPILSVATMPLDDIMISN